MAREQFANVCKPEYLLPTPLSSLYMFPAIPFIFSDWRALQTFTSISFEWLITLLIHLNPPPAAYLSFKRLFN
jgi:hypothetical protein